MDKCDYCQQLIDDIKDDIEFDSDIVALESLLLVLLNYNQSKSFDNWKYIILKYDIINLKGELDFNPIIKNYPEKLLQKVGIEKFFDYMKDISLTKAKIIYEILFNVYNSNCIIYNFLSDYIRKNENNKEKKLIKSVLDKSDLFSKAFFDKTELIKRVIVLHLENNRVCIDYLEELINLVNSKKDQAVLKTLLINYLIV